MVDYKIYVLLPDGSKAPIKQRNACDREETLNVWSGPAGTEDKQHQKILDRVEKLHVWMLNGHLREKIAWVSYRLKCLPILY